ncbi:hypothetical protein FB451DRAFT_1530923 [Mycena latifolia]|nr:hypothetical protein FB451DRAFT_1530923 [Mycena latifolia]
MSHRPGRALLVDLAAFPEPPTFIPVSPATPAFPAPPASPNPPPSRPPAAPLPPVPGPSRISDTDTLLFLQSTAPSRSRRSSRLSNRDSVASNRSDSLLSVSTGSLRSSPQTPSSAAQSLHSPSLAFSIDEHAELPDDLLESTPLQDIQKAPLDDDDDLALDDLTVSVPPVMPSSSAHRAARSTPPRTSTPRRESIALSSVAIPTTDSDTEPDFDALTPAQDLRAPSPDIQSILATTPRPRLSSISRRQTPQPYDEPWEEDFIDDYGHVRGSSIYSAASKASGPYAFGYPEQDDPDGQSLDGDDDHMLWDEPNDSDSDIDLHTSLPQLMLHHGFLSPRSKLVSNAASSASLALPSPASAAFPSTDSLLRDTRDTPKRRVRHRDGKTLRGGIGLTTGLGWSDSEDEDAPSALTRRISSLNLNRSSSHLGLSPRIQLLHALINLLVRPNYAHQARPKRVTRPCRRGRIWRRALGASLARAEPELARAAHHAHAVHSHRRLGAHDHERGQRDEPAADAQPQPRAARHDGGQGKAAPAHAESAAQSEHGVQPGADAEQAAAARGDGGQRVESAASTQCMVADAVVDAEHAPGGAAARFCSRRPADARARTDNAWRQVADAPAATAAAPARSRRRPRARARPRRVERRRPDCQLDGVVARQLRLRVQRAVRVDVRDVRVAPLAVSVGFPRGPPSPGFAPGTPTTPTTPMYETGVVRPRVGAGMKYRSSTMYSAPPARGLPVRAPAKAVAL